jgi:multiple sugar transport system substrate-binding protein
MRALSRISPIHAHKGVTVKFSRRTKLSAALVGAVSLALVATGCSSSSGGSTSGGVSGSSITYWASNQSGTTTAADVKILTPILAHFTKETGVKVNLEVIGWGQLQDNINNAVSSGSGPDVLNIGNTWAPYLAATGAFVPFEGKAATAIGGTSKFVPSALATGGLAGQAPTSVPYIGLSYGLFYNKALFAKAGISGPPATWEDLVTDAKKLTTGGVEGIGLEAGSYTENVHFAFITGEQNGGSWYDKAGNPTFTSAANVNGVLRYLNLMQDDGVVSKADAEYSTGTEASSDFSKGKVAMIVNQNNGNTSLTADGMSPSAYGVSNIPAPAGGKQINSGIQGINLSIFKNSKNQKADLEFIKFMTGSYAQAAIGRPYGTIPVVKGVTPNFAADKDFEAVFSKVYDTQAAPYPLVKSEGAFEQNVGAAVSGLFATIATGGTVTAADVKTALQTAQDKTAATQ